MIITAGIYKGRKLMVPPDNITRPTLSQTRMGVFNTLYSILGDFSDLSFLDLFGGSGIMGLEALSRGFGETVVFEKNKKAAEIIKKNYASLGIKPNLYIGDSLKLIKNFNTVFDVVYIDPPYASDVYESIIPLLKGNIKVIEHSGNIDLSGLDIIKQKKYGGNFLSFVK